MIAWPEAGNKTLYGEFCFGCTAPDVDKVSGTLTQKDTHFFDRTGDYEWMASRRSAAFIERQAEFLQQSFADLCPDGQAFVLGYLCHLCVDEVSKHMWRRETWLQFKSHAIGSAFAALDEAARQRIQDYPAIADAVCSAPLVDVIPRIPPGDLAAFHQGVCRFVKAADTEGEYLVLVDMFDRPSAQQRRERQQALRADLETVRGQVALFHLDDLVQASLAHSRRRLAELIEARRPQPDYPPLPVL